MKFYSLYDDSPESGLFWKRVGFACLLLAVAIDIVALIALYSVW